MTSIVRRRRAALRHRERYCMSGGWRAVTWRRRARGYSAVSFGVLKVVGQFESALLASCDGKRLVPTLRICGRGRAHAWRAPGTLLPGGRLLRWPPRWSIRLMACCDIRRPQWTILIQQRSDVRDCPETVFDADRWQQGLWSCVCSSVRRRASRDHLLHAWWSNVVSGGRTNQSSTLICAGFNARRQRDPDADEMGRSESIGSLLGWSASRRASGFRDVNWCAPVPAGRGRPRRVRRHSQRRRSSAKR